tara:strand:+ start:126 stop:845 length:720 start_codon:yes stop_codon:yes gene_type:complete
MLDVLEVLAPPITIIALILAIWQTGQSITATRELASIKKSLSTQFLGDFPSFNDDIADLLSSAKVSILIFCDLPGYGLISKPNSWHEISSIIEKKSKNTRINCELTVYDPNRIEQMLTIQIKKEGGAKSLFSDPEFGKKAQAGLAKVGEVVTPENYLELSLRKHEEILDYIFTSCDVKRTDKEMPFYFWMIDEREAIISIPTYSDKVSEYGFRTRDLSFINALLDIRKKVREDNPPNPG